MSKSILSSLALAMAMSLWLAGCQDTKARQENEQLKAQILQLQKDAGDLGNRIDVLTKENAELKAENERLKAKRPAKKSSKSRHRRAKSKPAASTQE